MSYNDKISGLLIWIILFNFALLLSVHSSFYGMTPDYYHTFFFRLLPILVLTSFYESGFIL